MKTPDPAYIQEKIQTIREKVNQQGIISIEEKNVLFNKFQQLASAKLQELMLQEEQAQKVRGKINKVLQTEEYIELVKAGNKESGKFNGLINAQLAIIDRANLPEETKDNIRKIFLGNERGRRKYIKRPLPNSL